MPFSKKMVTKIDDSKMRVKAQWARNCNCAGTLILLSSYKVKSLSVTRLMEAPKLNPTPWAEKKFGYVPFVNTDQAKCLNEEVLPSFYECQWKFSRNARIFQKKFHTEGRRQRQYDHHTKLKNTQYNRHVLKPETTKRNHRNETTETTETSETSETKRAKRAKRNRGNKPNHANYRIKTRNDTF